MVNLEVCGLAKPILIKRLVNQGWFKLKFYDCLKRCSSDENTKVFIESKCRKRVLSFFLFVDFLHQEAFPIALQLGFVLVDTKVLDDVFPIDAEIHFNH